MRLGLAQCLSNYSKLSSSFCVAFLFGEMNFFSDLDLYYISWLGGKTNFAWELSTYSRSTNSSCGRLIIPLANLLLYRKDMLDFECCKFAAPPLKFAVSVTEDESF